MALSGAYDRTAVHLSYLGVKSRSTPKRASVETEHVPRACSTPCGLLMFRWPGRQVDIGGHGAPREQIRTDWSKSMCLADTMHTEDTHTLQGCLCMSATINGWQIFWFCEIYSPRDFRLSKSSCRAVPSLTSKKQRGKYTPHCKQVDRALRVSKLENN